MTGFIQQAPKNNAGITAMRDEITGVVIATQEPRYLIDYNRQSQSSVSGSTLNMRSASPSVEIVLASASSSKALGSVIDIYTRQAQDYCKQKKWEKAAHACHEMLQVDPHNAEAYKLLGNIMQQQGEATDSMGFYAKAVALQPHFPEVYSNLGTVYASQKDWETAVLYYQKAIEQDATFAPAYWNLARVWRSLDRSEDEFRCKAFALKLQPEFGTAQDHYQLGESFEKEGLEEEAIAAYRRAVERDPDFLAAYQRLTDLLENQDDLEGSVACYKKVIALSGLTKKTVADDSVSANRTPPVPGLAKRPLAPVSVPVSESSAGGLSESSQAFINKLVQASSQKKLLQPDAVMAAPKRLTAVPKATRAPATQIPARSPAEVGQQFIAAKDWPRAIAAFKQAIQQNPRSAALYRTLAKLFNLNKQPRHAAVAWYRGFALEPEWPSVQQWLELGKVLRQQGNVKDAVVCYQRVVRLRPDFGPAYESLAQMLQGLGELAGAEAVLKRYAALKQSQKLGDRSASGTVLNKVSSSSPNAALSTAPNKVYKSAQVPERPDLSVPEATETAEAIKEINQNKQKAFAMHKQGEELRQQEKWTEAIAAYSRAAELNPDFSWSRHSLGDCYQKLGDWKAAKTAYRQAIAINPEFVWSHYSLGEVQEKLKNWGEAVDAYTHALELEPESSQISLSLAEALKKGADSDQQKASDQFLALAQTEGLGEEVYRQAIALNPGDVSIYGRLSRVLADKGRVDEAIFVCQTALQVEPSSVDGLLQLAKLLAKQMQWVEAIDCVNRALTLDGQSAAAYFRMGDVLSEKGDLEGAHGAYWRSLELDGENYWTHQCIGNVCLWQNRFDEAIASYRQVIEMNPELATAHKQMGDAYTALGKVDEASEAYARAIEIDPQVS